MESPLKPTSTRRAKWQYPPPQPAPKILHLPPHRPSKKAPPKPKASPLKPPALHDETKVMLVSLFDQERSFSRGVNPTVLVSPSNDEEKRENSGVSLVEEEKWRLQAEILRAECNLLRMERDIAVKRMERRRMEMERTLKSAVQTLVYGRTNIREGSNARSVFDGQIDELSEKLEKLQKRSRVKDMEVKICSNFDEQMCFLRRQPDEFGGFSDEEIRLKEIRQMAEASLSIRSSSEDHESFASNGNNNDTMPLEARVCSGHCKAMVRRIIEQVRAETEQWSQMQEMLGQVRDEMEELRRCRDFWEDRARDSDHQIRSLQSVAKEWERKAISSKAKANKLQKRVSVLQEAIERLWNERERRVLVCCSKENRRTNDVGSRARMCSAAGLVPQRSPLRETANTSASMKQHGEGILPFYCLPEM